MQARDVEGARANAAELEHMLAAALLAHKPDLTIQELHSSLHALGKGLLHGRPNGPVHAGALEYLKQTFETVRKEQVAALQEASAQVARLTQQLHVCQQQLRAARAAAKVCGVRCVEQRQQRLALGWGYVYLEGTNNNNKRCRIRNARTLLATHQHGPKTWQTLPTLLNTEQT